MNRYIKFFFATAVLFTLAFLSLSFANPFALSADEPIERWAGHQVVFGQTEVPVLGKRETRSDSFVLAEVKRRPNRIEFRQTACKVTFKEVMGAKVHIPESALLRLPSAEFSFVPEGDVLRAAPWQVGWSRQDVDGDGRPGLTVDVDASICGGKLYIASSTRSAAFGKLTEDGMWGKISVRVKQRVLDTDSACLKMFSADTDETQSGGFAYRRVSDDATCDSLLAAQWPVKALLKR